MLECGLSLEVLTPTIWTNSDHIDLKTLWKYPEQLSLLPSPEKCSSFARCYCRWEFVRRTGATSLPTPLPGMKTQQKYLGLKAGEAISPSLSQQSLLVKPEVAQQQLETEREAET